MALREAMRLAASTGLAVVALSCLVAAPHVRHPVVCDLRPWLIIGILAGTAVVGLLSLWLRRGQSGRWGSRIALIACLISLAAMSVALAGEIRFQFARWTVRTADPEAVARFGRHIVVGYRDAGFVRDLVDRRAIAGIFLTRRNAAGRRAATGRSRY
jgi:beta-N-acetylhexosaminidase